MPHDTPLISTIVMGLVLAFIFGAIANKLRMPPLVGYLVAGVLAGPYTPGFVADQGLAPELAEIGVILLMFGVGLHFSLKDLLSVRFIAVPGALVQIAFATLLGWGLGELMGWSLGGSLVFGLALSVASTVVLLKALQERRLVETERGKIAVGWLIVEDLAMVLALVLIPAAASISGDGHAPVEPLSAAVNRLFDLDLGIGGIIGMTLLKVALFVALMLVFGRRVIPWILHRTAHTGSRELFRLGVLAIALGVAFGAAKLFGVSLALGAFFAGMVLAESELSHRAAQESLPLRDAFAVLFFVSVGMLFDPSILLEHPLLVLATVFIIVVGKSAAAFLIVLAFRKPIGTALTISASLAQIGEFSFILAAMGVELGLLPEQGRDLILAGAIISIILNPLVFYGCGRLKRHLDAKNSSLQDASAEADAAAQTHAAEEEVPVIGAERDPGPTTLTGHVVVVGYGRVGSIVGQNLLSSGTPFLVIEDAEKRVIDLRDSGIEAISGNAASAEVLGFANLSAARSLVIAIPNAFEACSVAEQARSLNPSILIVARAHSDAEVDELTRYGADTVIMGEREIALGMVDRLRQVHHDRPLYEDAPSADRIADTLVTTRE
ncbi:MULTISPECIES: YbaL family putative K(+) efflux transporter [unclassified Rhizobium]|uniref:YbaL family putative K(+) efflux transporter n=1 Tax=unclassified Rhizobium TaxID=2613769 RepID=UPI001ADD4209|nr:MULTISPECIES: YbaL family putative K(+) efflux transporter [unclassified Rhizobium]MBO9097245.1 Kef family K(+) transporter [Rhizobium sp. L58/93]MBO9133903.1 Kef family K(+) transporter [Rhizobium sp. B209b/85]MBO9167484.1 Kef family K(+) transporter [Rhizobium sp. L245/93]MBO9183443.1 Kef family K(+) transporter [Rhizobium sp. E27B/91]QXZ83777.1 Kef family K(+) transporter [Rhizobium sp. K1/93]